MNIYTYTTRKENSLSIISTSQKYEVRVNKYINFNFLNKNKF
jgi:LysM repeat protein